MVSATQVKELRDATGAGMMECKKALEATQGDFEKAVEELRKAGIMKAGKKASRIAADGVVIIRLAADGQSASMVEINCETDFVARDQHFLEFANHIADVALKTAASDVATLLNGVFANNGTVEEARQALVAKVGENINIRRVAFVKNAQGLGAYSHGTRIGVLVELNAANPELAKDLAMHIAASKPLVIAANDVPADLVTKEKEIYLAQAAGSGKPQDIIEKMVNGRIKKYLDEISLMGQPFVKDPNVTVASLLAKQRAEVIRFTRFEVGEGIEKTKEDFVEAVMSQVQGG